MAAETGQPQQRCTKCKRINVWRIQLRDCSHVVCIPCGIVHLKWWIKEKEKPRIKCPKDKCPVRIHENDVRALLDERNTSLDAYVGKSQREWLLHRHDKHVIGYALGGEGRCRQCPLCKNMYAEVEGCHFVRCPNLRCHTRFCFECGDPINSWQHFSKGTCRLSWDDLWRLSYVFRFVFFANPTVLVILAPIVFVMLMVIAPLFITIALPFLILKQEYIKMKTHPNNLEKSLFAIKAIFGGPLLLFAGVLLGFGSFWTVLPLWLLYCFGTVLRCIPPTRTAFTVLDQIGLVAGCFGMADWRSMLKDSKEARLKMLIDREQAEAEQNERLPEMR